MTLSDAMNNVDNQELVASRTARQRAVAVNAVLEIISTHQRNIVTDNDAMLIEAIYQTLRQVAPAGAAPTLKSDGAVSAPVAKLIDTLNGV